MPFLAAKLTFLKKKKATTFAIIRRNNDLLLRDPTRLRALIPKISHILRPHPTLHLERSPLLSPKEDDDAHSLSPTPSVCSLDIAPDPRADDFLLPPSAVPWPPQTCAAPLSTHHRLGPCDHVVRTPFLSPCGANCAHVGSSAAAAAAARAFVVGAFACAVCVDEGVRRAAEGMEGAFGALLERNSGVLREGEREVLVGAHGRIVRREVEAGRRGLMARGRWCEGAEVRDGHGRGCP